MTFQVHISERLPEIIVSDPWRLRQIISNLLTNAFKFTKQGKVSLSIAPHENRMNSDGTPSINIEIKDSGCGIDPQFQPHVFTPFRQEDNSHALGRTGAGLGLAISKRLAELLNGSLTFTSAVGKGSVFSFALSRVKED